MSRLLAAAVLLSVALVACAPRDAVEGPATDGGGAVSAMCAPEVPDCVDMVVSDDGASDEFDAEQSRAQARSLVGVAEDELDSTVRIGRRGGEQMMLTEDYVLGRMTVELDELNGEFRVTTVTVELPDGPETYGG